VCVCVCVKEGVGRESIMCMWSERGGESSGGWGVGATCNRLLETNCVFGGER
jgi:hypothetical protein